MTVSITSRTVCPVSSGYATADTLMTSAMSGIQATTGLPPTPITSAQESGTFSRVVEVENKLDASPLTGLAGAGSASAESAGAGLSVCYCACSGSSAKASVGKAITTSSNKATTSDAKRRWLPTRRRRWAIIIQMGVPTVCDVTVALPTREPYTRRGIYQYQVDNRSRGDQKGIDLSMARSMVSV